LLKHKHITRVYTHEATGFRIDRVSITRGFLALIFQISRKSANTATYSLRSLAGVCESAATWHFAVEIIKNLEGNSREQKQDVLIERFNKLVIFFATCYSHLKHQHPAQL
jgi:hypothetical protein